MNDELAKLMIGQLERIAEVLESLDKRLAKVSTFDGALMIEGHLRTEGA
jgi:hypothetical protein